MSFIKIAICDDDEDVLKLLKIYCVKYFEENSHYKAEKINIFKTSSELIKSLLVVDYDIIFLDINIDEISGITLAEMIRKNNNIVNIIFVTGVSDKLHEAFGVFALNYILKPINYNHIEKTLNVYFERNCEEKKFLVFDLEYQTIKVRLSDIMYVQKKYNYIEIYTQENVYNIRMSIKEILERLDENFINCHKSFIVNFNYISYRKRDTFILINNKIIDIGKTHQKEAKELFSDFIINKKGAFLC